MNPPTKPPPQTGNRISRSQKVFQRAYMACLSCRRIKAKCEISDDLNTCVRCKREQRPCVFSARRSATQSRRADDLEASAGANSEAEEPISMQEEDQAPRPEQMDISESSSRNDRNMPLQHGRLSHSPRHTRDQIVSPADSDLGSNWSPEVVRADLETELMQTVVASSQDAINLLFKAATVEQEGEEPVSNNCNQQAQSGENQGFYLALVSGVQPYPQEVLDCWNKSRFVRQGWLSAREGIAYIDLFFANLSHLSLVTNTYFARHENHQTLIFQEPLLCSTLLMISSRHHPLAESTSASRSHIVHDLFWRHIEHLIHRLAFGNYVHAGNKSRSLGCVEALLLLTEWHPRAVHAPQSADCCDSHEGPGLEIISRVNPGDIRDNTRTKWCEEVFEPAKRAERMSWMMLGIASSLAHELGIYDDPDGGLTDRGDSAAKQRLRRLLYLNVNQLSLTLGCGSFLPFGVSDIALNSITSIDSAYWEGEKVISMWIDLTSLLKMAKGMSSSTQAGVRDATHNGLLNHFQPLLGQWYQRFQEFKPKKVSTAAIDLLFIDYQYVKMFVASVGIQDLVERLKTDMGTNLAISNILRLGNTSDFQSTKEVLDASLSILTKTVELARSNVLRYCPARVFFRITSACVFLLKILGLGILNTEMTESLGLLDRCIDALASASDENYLWGKCAILIRRYARHFKNKIEAVNSGPAAVAISNSISSSIPVESDFNPGAANGEMQNSSDLPYDFETLDGIMDTWQMQPWDLWMSSSNMQVNQPALAPDNQISDFSHNLFSDRW